jgi:hypothetical protein
MFNCIIYITFFITSLFRIVSGLFDALSRRSRRTQLFTFAPKVVSLYEPIFLV